MVEGLGFKIKGCRLGLRPLGSGIRFRVLGVVKGLVQRLGFTLLVITGCVLVFKLKSRGASCGF